MFAFFDYSQKNKVLIVLKGIIKSLEDFNLFLSEWKEIYSNKDLKEHIINEWFAEENEMTRQKNNAKRKEKRLAI